MKIGELFVQLGVRSDIQKLNAFVSAMRRGVLESAALIAGLTGISLVFRDIFTGALDSARSLRTFRNTTGLSTAELQKWQIAGEKVGITNEAMQGSIAAINREMVRVRWAGAPSEGFKLFGLSPDLNAFQNLLRIRKIMLEQYGDDPDRATQLLRSLGISPEIMNLLTLPQKRFEGTFPRGNEFSYLQQQQKEALKLDRQIAEIHRKWTKLSVDLLIIMVPVFDKIANSLNRVLEAMVKFKASPIYDIFSKTSDVYEKTGGNVPLKDSWLGQLFSRDRAKELSNVDNSNVTVNVTVNGMGDQTGDPKILTRHIQDAISQMEVVK